jgi:hypothetical protein
MNVMLVIAAAVHGPAPGSSGHSVGVRGIAGNGTIDWAGLCRLRARV